MHQLIKAPIKKACMSQAHEQRLSIVARTPAVVALAFFAWVGSVSAQGKPDRGVPEPSATPTLLSVLGQAAAVVEGVVSKIDFTYTDAEGPWTVVTLSQVSGLLGTVPSEIQLRIVGGPKPDGKWLKVSNHPVFVLKEKYVVVLRNTRWHLSPILNNLALRETTFEGAEVLVDSSGGLVTGVSSSGVEISSPVFEAPMLNGSTVPTLAPQANISAASTPIFNGKAVPADAAQGNAASGAKSKLNRDQFLSALQGEAAARGVSVSGRFYDQPADGDDWRNSPVAGTPPMGASSPDGIPQPDPFAPITK